MRKHATHTHLKHASSVPRTPATKHTPTRAHAHPPARGRTRPIQAQLRLRRLGRSPTCAPTRPYASTGLVGYFASLSWTLSLYSTSVRTR